MMEKYKKEEIMSGNLYIYKYLLKNKILSYLVKFSMNITFHSDILYNNIFIQYVNFNMLNNVPTISFNEIVLTPTKIKCLSYEENKLQMLETSNQSEVIIAFYDISNNCQNYKTICVVISGYLKINYCRKKYDNLCDYDYNVILMNMTKYAMGSYSTY